MQTIQHTFHIDTSFSKVFEALTTVEGLSSWWTKTTSGNPTQGGILEFKFSEYATFEMDVVKVIEDELVEWKNISGNPAWEGTTIQFRLSENEGKVMVQFTHGAFADDYADLGNINFSWGRYLVSLRDHCENGNGDPFEG